MRTKLVEVARAEIGYLEKQSLKNLDDKKANAGYENYTKYWRDLYPQFQGQPWCDCFVDWCFERAFGSSEAARLECGGNRTFYTPSSAEAYKRNERWSENPQVGAQIFFRNEQRICHTGIVDSYDSDYVTTIEGNTTSDAGVIANGGAVCRKAYARNDPRIAGYGIPDYREDSMLYTTVTRFLSAVRAVYLKAHTEDYQYGDSKGMPPTSDHYISCDRLVAKACWDLGWHEQPQGGITVINMEGYLTKWGFTKLTSKSELKRGDIVLMKAVGTSKPTALWHTFVLTEYDPKTEICSKYDMGSQPRIESLQPFKNVPLNEWTGAVPIKREFYCGFRIPVKPKDYERYKVDAEPWKKGNNNYSVLLGKKLLKARGYKGADNRPLKLTKEADDNAIHALMAYKEAANLPLNSKVFNRATWSKATRISADADCNFIVENWEEGTSSESVYLAQLILRAEGYKGANNKALILDGVAGGNTLYALVEFKKKNGLNETAKCKLTTWRKLLDLPVKKI